MINIKAWHTNTIKLTDDFQTEARVGEETFSLRLESKMEINFLQKQTKLLLPELS